jgi:hypothetical protein
MVSKRPHVLAADFGYGKLPNVISEPAKLSHGGMSGLLRLPPTCRPLFALVVVYGL